MGRESKVFSLLIKRHKRFLCQIVVIFPVFNVPPGLLMTSASSSVSEEDEEEEEEDSSMEAMPNLGAEVSERSFRKWREES